ncbi:6-phosphogluconate dehydrogenase [Flavobacterium okayamense]|uniref:6-phosphogluconate dehydrogenase n=1 Tax=Flavobacterium okayamense TaxID=2830782 RepID=A0ABM7S7V6_9FLAO|nr:6-phosphogluconate dehydrogenase [Flavobacterium okayamense]BCY29644.1 6-phosphogluconate dehydrogenase [Flavobacterium okayamense]
MAKLKKFLLFTVLFLFLGFIGYYSFVYYVPYSEGVRSGELIKISNKGYIIKTWEGEISQGISGAQIFSFSVEGKNQEIINQLKDYQGMYVKVEYVERYRTFFWWGDTRYFITKVERENSPHFNINTYDEK